MAIYSMNAVDYIIIGIILFSTLTSSMRGFIAEAISLLTWIIAAIVAFRFAEPVGNLLLTAIHAPHLRLVVAFFIVLILVLIVGAVINHFFSAFIKSTGLTGTNRLLGMIFGFARGILLVAILILFTMMTSFVKSTWWHYSVLIPYFIGIANWLQHLIPSQLYHFQHLTHSKT